MFQSEQFKNSQCTHLVLTKFKGNYFSSDIKSDVNQNVQNIPFSIHKYSASIYMFHSYFKGTTLLPCTEKFYHIIDRYSQARCTWRPINLFKVKIRSQLCSDKKKYKKDWQWENCHYQVLVIHVLPSVESASLLLSHSVSAVANLKQSIHCNINYLNIV